MAKDDGATWRARLWQVYLGMLSFSIPLYVTVLQAMMLIECFDEHDVGTIMNEHQTHFGLESIHDKFFWAALDIKDDFQLSQTQLNQMISGERMAMVSNELHAQCGGW